MEVAFVEPMLMALDPENIGIPAGTVAVVPHIIENDDVVRNSGEDDQSPLPEGTLLMAGQQLDRDSYPELSREYHDSGGFGFFILPNLVKKFIIGVDAETNEIQWGDGIIYYKTFPEVEIRIRDIRQQLPS